MPIINTPKIALNVESHGPESGTALVFSNSLGANLSMWADQVGAFSGTYRVITYDQRGHGHSAVPGAAFTLADLAADVVAILDALDIERAHFVGLSMGGMTALQLALAHAGRLLSITACNCVAGYPPAGRAIWDERMQTVRDGGIEAVLEGTISRWFTAPTIAARPADMDAVRDMLRATPVDGYLGCCGAIQQLDLDDRLADIALPTLLIGGSDDVGAPPAAMQAMQAAISGSQYVELKAAHVSNMERPAEFNAALTTFLAGI